MHLHVSCSSLFKHHHHLVISWSAAQLSGKTSGLVCFHWVIPLQLPCFVCCWDLLFIFFLDYVYACSSDCKFVHVCAMPLRLEKTLDPLALALQESCLMWVLWLELWSSARTAHALWPLGRFHWRFFFTFLPTELHCLEGITIRVVCGSYSCVLLCLWHCPRYQLIIFLMHILHWQHSCRSRWHGVRQGQRSWASWLYLP